MADWRDLILSNKLDILKPFWHFYFTKIVKLQTCLLSKSFAHFTVCGSTSRKIYNDLSSLLQGYTKGIFSFIFFSSSSEVSLWFTFVCLFSRHLLLISTWRRCFDDSEVWSNAVEWWGLSASSSPSSFPWCKILKGFWEILTIFLILKKDKQLKI